jgi:hypothetical protein
MTPAISLVETHHQEIAGAIRDFLGHNLTRQTQAA